MKTVQTSPPPHARGRDWPDDPIWGDEAPKPFLPVGTDAPGRVTVLRLPCGVAVVRAGRADRAALGCWGVGVSGGERYTAAQIAELDALYTEDAVAFEEFLERLWEQERQDVPDEPEAGS